MMSLKVQTKSQEICRMSWFLVEMDEGQVKGGKINGRTIYGVIHSIDLIDSASTYMYIDRKIRFNWNHAIIEGRLKFASDDRCFIEQQFKTLTKNNENGIITNFNRTKTFLIQYNRSVNTLVHAIVHEKEIVWSKDDIENSVIREVLIRDGRIQRMATVLHINNSEDLMQKDLDVLKNRCFGEAFIEPHDNKDIEQTPWLLVQYSNCPTNISYSVVHLNDTVLQAENLYRNVVAYILDNDAIYQASILRKSEDRNELDKQLLLIRNSCLMEKFPIETCQSKDKNGNTTQQLLTTKIGLQPPIHLQGIYGNPVKIFTCKRNELQVLKN